MVVYLPKNRVKRRFLKIFYVQIQMVIYVLKIKDKVAEVRTETTEVICSMLQQPHQQLNTFLIQQIVENVRFY